MELKLATTEKEVVEELVKFVESLDLRGDNGNLKECLSVYDKNVGSSSPPPSDPLRRSSLDEFVDFLNSFKKIEDLQVLKCHANHLLIEKFKQESQDNDNPEQMLVRLTVEHPNYSLDYSFQPYSEEWFVSDVGMKPSKVMKSTNNIVAVDCEMVVLDEFVKPDKLVVDYRTDITGITAQDIENATLSVSDIQETLQPFLSNGTILIGHSLNRDLEVLKIDHPKVIDTSLVFKYPNARRLRRPSLNNLCMSILGYEVRKEGVSHDCVNDAAAAMKLVLAVIEKRVDTTIKPSKEMLEAEKSRLFLHKVRHNVPSKKLEQVLSGNFTLDIKPAKVQGGYYCAFVVFDSSEEADQAFENVHGEQMTDSLGLPQKLVVVKLSSGSRTSLYVRKMVKDDDAT